MMNRFFKRNLITPEQWETLERFGITKDTNVALAIALLADRIDRGE